MNRKHQKTLRAIFSVPTSASINFADIEKLLVALGTEVEEGSGSRLAFTLNNQKLFVRRPHPAKEAKKYQVENFQEFLKLAGVTDE